MRVFARIFIREMKTPNPFRTAKALWSIAQLVRDPNRLNQVFEIADALATPAQMNPILEDISAEPAVARSLEERHRIHVDIEALRKLPAGTLGREFAEHMIANGLDPNALPDLESNDPIAYFRAHMYETHDIWHVVTGFAADYRSEIGLQAFYLAQIPGGLPALLIATGFLRVGIYDRASIRPLGDQFIRGWKMGRDAKPLFGVHWDELWDKPLTEIRETLGIVIPEAPASTLRAA